MSTVAEKLAKKSTKRPSTKQVRLKLVYIDFWSAVKLSFLVAVALAVITIVFFFLVYTVLDRTGLFGEIDKLYETVAGEGMTLTDLFGLGQVMGFAVVLAILNLVVITALGAITAALYNLSVKITGGLLVGFTNN
ncbi:DUF3566 domain-containing protein [Okibacterium fritillariae]|jgi:hypothetical protein|uniref:DUF3566 domain-containing protein n=1 Tax=Okibacterium fritillariae TaxID=123320 RepID=A0A1T5I853_9MICO|nr:MULTISPECIES: DUF3566 domain-containing protein [Microbacteriaceae]ONI60942.1 hypothetical protein ALI44B_10435 [Leifsonia sp. ALI-44-B]SKC35298.1 Transmembrane protein of unknown function [Okibacterium fritillariae]